MLFLVAFLIWFCSNSVLINTQTGQNVTMPCPNQPNWLANFT